MKVPLSGGVTVDRFDQLFDTRLVETQTVCDCEGAPWPVITTLPLVNRLIELMYKG
jgi:hypothetical protein